MNGSLQLKRGVWQAVIYYSDESGNPKQKWISTKLPERGNKKAAKEILNRELERFEKTQAEAKEKIERRGKPKEVDKSQAIMPFPKYCDLYVENIKDNLSPQVYESYKGNIKKLEDYFDKRKLRVIDVTDEEIKDFYAEQRELGLKDTSIRHLANIIRPALKQARKDQLIPDNPYDYVPPLLREKPSLDFYDKREMAKLFEVIEGNRFELLIKMAGYYGFRRSEIIGLRWKAIDFDHKTISVNHKVLVVGSKVKKSNELKTAMSRRTLPLIPAIEELLLAHKKEVEENKKFYGKSYNQDYLDYVFVEENGKLIYPDVVTHNFAKILKNNGLKHIRFHDLRHSCASIMLANGIQMKQIQEWLGHSHYSTTADVYSHLDFSAKIQSANAIFKALAPERTETIPKPQESTYNPLQEFYDNMKKQGYDDFNEYIAFLEQKAGLRSLSETESDGNYEMH